MNNILPFFETDIWFLAAYLRLNPDHTRFDLWWRSKVVLADFHNMRDLSPELSIDTQTAV